MGSFAVAGLVACSSDRGASATIPVDRSHAVPVLAGETSPAGTPLRDGFSVPAGTALVGPVLPVVIGWTFGGVRPQEWVAFLVVDDAPAAVFDELVAQAVAAGFSGMATAADLGCVGPQTEDVEQGTVGPNAVSCSARGVSEDRSRAVEITLNKGRFCGAWIAQASVELSDLGDTVELPVTPGLGEPGESTVAATRNPRPRGALGLTGPGATIDIENVYTVDRNSLEDHTTKRLRIEQGSQPVLGFISQICWFTVNPRTVLMRVDDGPAALSDYERQAVAMDGWDETVQAEPQIDTRGSWTISAVRFDNTDTSVVIELYEPGDGDGPSYLRIVVGNGA